MRVLAVRQDRLGDALLTLPALEALKASGRVEKLVLQVRRELVPLMGCFPPVDEVHPTDYRLNAGEMRAQVAWLRQEQFDAALLFKPNSEAHTLITASAKVPIRIGSTDRDYASMLTHGLELTREWDQHEAERCWQLARLLVPDLPPPGKGSLNVTERSELVRPGDYFVVAPGTGGTTRRWPAGRFARLARSIKQSTGWSPVVVGAARERDVAQEMAADSVAPFRDLVGRTDVLELARVVAGAKLVVCANTGPRHLAAALGVPVLTIETMPDPGLWYRRYAPWQVEHEAVLEEPTPSLPTAQAAADRLLDRLA